MLPKKERLKRISFSRYFSMGKHIHAPSLQLVYTPFETLHVSVVASKKVAKLAVKRNKLRRRIYDMVRRYRQEKDMHGVYIFLTKAGAATKTFSELQEEVLMCLEKAQKYS